MAGLGRTWCVRCGCDIEGGGSGREWEEEEEMEEEESYVCMLELHTDHATVCQGFESDCCKTSWVELKTKI